jgi:hypothetical protein
MSIQQTIDQAKRAQAVIDAKAKRGMLAVVERRHSYVSLKDGHHSASRFVPSIVTSVRRDGAALRVRVTGPAAELRLDRRDWLACYVDSRGTIGDPAGVVAKLTNEFGVANEYDTFAAAQSAIKAAAGLA